MKVECNKNEFALLVRACECNKMSKMCNGCLFFGLCSNSDDTGVEAIEDICEISVEG